MLVANLANYTRAALSVLFWIFTLKKKIWKMFWTHCKKKHILKHHYMHFYYSRCHHREKNQRCNSMGWSRRRPAHGCSTGSSAAAFSPFCSFQISLLVSWPVLQLTSNANGQFCSYCNDIQVHVHHGKAPIFIQFPGFFKFAPKEVLSYY